MSLIVHVNPLPEGVTFRAKRDPSAILTFSSDIIGVSGFRGGVNVARVFTECFRAVWETGGFRSCGLGVFVHERLFLGAFPVEDGRDALSAGPTSLD